MKIRCVITIFLFVWTMSTAGGQTCCSGGVPLANSIGGLPLADSGTLQISGQLDVNILNTLKDESQILDDDSRSRKTWSALIHAGVPLNNRISVEGLFSWVRQERLIKQAGGFEDFTFTQGIGDGVLLVQYRWWNKGRLQLITGGGVKVPLGSTEQLNKNGIALSADLQPGTGAWDMVFSQKIEWYEAGSSLFNMVGNMVYRITGTNDQYLNTQKYRFGNELQIMMGVGRQFFLANQLFDLQAGLRYRNTLKDFINGDVLANTGGHWLYGNLGSVWRFTPTISASAAVDLPLYSYVTGTQLSPTVRFTIGGYYMIR